jgi:hypothetical protein
MCHLCDESVAKEVGRSLSSSIWTGVPMESVLSPPLSDQRAEGDAVSVVPKESPMVEMVWSGVQSRDAEAVRGSSERSGDLTGKKTDLAGLRAEKFSAEAPPQSFGIKNEQQLVSKTPSIGRRAFRSLFRFLTAVLIGVAGTLAWQTYGDDAKEQAVDAVQTWAPSLASLLPALGVKWPPVIYKSPEQSGSNPAAQGATQNASLTQTSPGVQEQTSIAADSSSELAQQVETMTRELASLRQNIDQLSLKQEQMAQNIAALQDGEQDIRKIVSSPPPSAAEAVPLPPRKTTSKGAASPPAPAAQSSSRAAAASRSPLPPR